MSQICPDDNPAVTGIPPTDIVRDRGHAWPGDQLLKGEPHVIREGRMRYLVDGPSVRDGHSG